MRSNRDKMRYKKARRAKVLKARKKSENRKRLHQKKKRGTPKMKKQADRETREALRGQFPDHRRKQRGDYE